MGNLVFVGGDFTSIYNNEGDRLTRNYIAAFNRHTGEPTSFAPDLDDKVFAIRPSGNTRTIFVGGAFQAVGSSTRKRIAEFNMTLSLIHI